MSHLKPTPELNESRESSSYLILTNLYMWSSSSMNWSQASPRHLVDPPSVVLSIYCKKYGTPSIDSGFTKLGCSEHLHCHCVKEPDVS